jgi:Ser/Thr protein kinase RdoA (MazF antagonist)
LSPVAGAAAPKDSLPEEIERAFPALAGGFEILQGASGLLHKTIHLRARDGRAFVLQRLSDAFDPGIHTNITRVSAHLRAHGVTSLELERTLSGEPYLELAERGRWRLLVRIEGASFDRVQSSAQIESAGAAVGRFHAALDDFDEALLPMGMPFRDTPYFRGRLEQALADHAHHPERDAVARLRDALEAGFDALGEPIETAHRVIHGDLKISNVLFASAEPPGRDRAIALIDLDTLMWAPLWCEWGDAWRSWCNRRGEDESEARFDSEVFEASLVGFRRGYGRALSSDERSSLVDATERLALELAVRYATDALEQRYFAWDPDRFPTAHAHNLLRARGQLSLYRAAQAVRDRSAEAIESRLA